ncbi:MAG: thiol-disulfide oxidoreductase DCC family protein [Flavobacteriales bacterium]
MKKIILFDSTCLMCNNFVKYLIKLDKDEVFKFSSTNGVTAKKIFEKSTDQLEKIDSVIFYNKKVYTKSSAVINILSELGGIYKLAYIFNIIPSFISDSIYDYIARNRFQWFGKLDKCPMPEKKNISRFLD